MTDERPETGAQAPEPDRYYAEHVPPPAGGESLSVAALQEAVNAGARQSWRLVGVVGDPTGRGVILVWDQMGFISG